MKFLVPNYSCLQNPWLWGYRSQIPVLSVLCPQLNLLNPREKNSWVRRCAVASYVGQCARSSRTLLYCFVLYCIGQLLCIVLYWSHFQQIWNMPTNLIKTHSAKLDKDPTNGSWDVPCRNTDGRTDITKPGVVFRSCFAKAPAGTETNQRLRVRGEIAGIRTRQSIALPLR
jgi:hypothetical protein